MRDGEGPDEAAELADGVDERVRRRECLAGVPRGGVREERALRARGIEPPLFNSSTDLKSDGSVPVLTARPYLNGSI